MRQQFSEYRARRWARGLAAGLNIEHRSILRLVLTDTAALLT
jgi:hypothetical protein